MRTVISMLLLFLCSNKAFCQNQHDSFEKKNISNYETEAQFKGEKNETIKMFMDKHLEYPKTKDKLKGRVILTFQIDTDGSVKNIKIIRSLRRDYDLCAINLVKEFPKFIPSQDLLHKKPRKSTMVCPVYFK